MPLSKRTHKRQIKKSSKKTKKKKVLKGGVTTTPNHDSGKINVEIKLSSEHLNIKILSEESEIKGEDEKQDVTTTTRYEIEDTFLPKCGGWFSKKNCKNKYEFVIDNTLYSDGTTMQNFSVYEIEKYLLEKLKDEEYQKKYLIYYGLESFQTKIQEINNKKD